MYITAQNQFFLTHSALDVPQKQHGHLDSNRGLPAIHQRLHKCFISVARRNEKEVKINANRRLGIA